MSTQPRQPSERRDRDHLFKRIQRSVIVCSNCFSITNADKFEPYTWRDSIREIIHPIWLSGDGANEHQFSSSPPQCTHCGIGSVMANHRETDGQGHGESLTKREALHYAANLSETLETFWIAHDGYVLLDVVFRRKTTPEFASKDDENFEVALSAALRTDPYGEVIPDFDNP